MNTGHQTTGVCRSGAEIYSVYLEEAANGWRVTVIVYGGFGFRLPMVHVYVTGYIPEADARRLGRVLDDYAYSREEEKPFSEIINRARSMVMLKAPVYMLRADIDKEWRG